MTLDQMQYLFVGLFGPLAIYIILRALPLQSPARWVLGVVLAAWFVLTAITPLRPVGPFPGALFGIALPVVVVGLIMGFTPTVRHVIVGMNVPLLVGLHSTRLIGGFFVLLHAEGRLSNPFAMIAGWGDVLAATLAIPAAIIAWNAKPGWEKWVLAWSVIGFIDFMSAVGLGITSQPGSPLRVFFEAPGTAILGQLPWRFIPNFFVPLYIMIHIALFIRLAPAVFGRRSESPPGALATHGG
ncbi:MAG: hypothetical protein ACRCWF_13520 [Beijerinckiaceae bacterium]